MKYIRLALISTFIIFSNAEAALIDNGIITTDSRTQLQWLDLTETTNMSYNYVSTQFGTGGAFEGWAYATPAQVSSLFDSAGGTGPYDGDSIINNGIVEPLITLWGATQTINNLNSSHFIVAQFGYNTTEAHETGSISNLMLDPIIPDYYITDPDADYLRIINSVWLDTDSASFMGSALVRTTVVPLPPALLLFISGLMSLITLSRRKNI